MPMSPSTVSSSSCGIEDTFSASHYTSDRQPAYQHPAPGEQAKWNAAGAFYAYHYPYYTVDTFGRPQYFSPYGPHPFPASQPYPTAPNPYHAYNGYFGQGYPQPSAAAPQSAYTYPTPSSPSSTRSTSPQAKPSSIRSITPPTSPPPPALLTPAEFIHKLQEIRLENRAPGPVGRFHILGEGLPVSVSQPRQNGPFVIQHYLPDGRADVISIAHVFEFEGAGAERGVIVWCPPPRVQYFGVNV
ncbi:hypothetical protein FRC10_007428 [Ceratobasidium sp. 414]|nr:hypothetical protein FRC10_007428 [Ceratobasidium sp. 414]